MRTQAKADTRKLRLLGWNQGRADPKPSRWAEFATRVDLLQFNPLTRVEAAGLELAAEIVNA